MKLHPRQMPSNDETEETYKVVTPTARKKIIEIFACFGYGDKRQRCWMLMIGSGKKRRKERARPTTTTREEQLYHRKLNSTRTGFA